MTMTLRIAQKFLVIGLFWTKHIFPFEFRRQRVEVFGDGAMTFGVFF
jgi:hypothetical protein